MIRNLLNNAIGILLSPYTTNELQKLATQYDFPRGLLYEAQEVMLREGWTPREIRKGLPRLCLSAKAQGGTAEKFHALLQGQIATFRAAKSLSI